ncbi:MAG: hypothetical protein COA96_04890 [SAR86 cluster bacterium]|uniref:Flagellar protein FlgJ N-terminal domain-containing protein n=1 Tax=SAR86 cluster bacterium TaxID=2030880 RepID=A0A2A5B545_9GAMM|nr:MAG: hypothetical protein COA96_04890 [SAR86 cluster bacterium]
MSDGLASVYNNFSGLSSLKLQARVDPSEAAKEVAQQFESIFVGMMMKAMRDATPKDGLFNSDQMEAYQEMFDQQLALDMSASGGLGLGRIIEQQIAMASKLN